VWDARAAAGRTSATAALAAGGTLAAVGGALAAAGDALAAAGGVLTAVGGVEILEHGCVEALETFGGVGFLACVGRRRPAEPVPRLVQAARGEQRVAIGVEPAGRPGPQPPIVPAGN